MSCVDRIWHCQEITAPAILQVSNQGWMIKFCVLINKMPAAVLNPATSIGVIGSLSYLFHFILLYHPYLLVHTIQWSECEIILYNLFAEDLASSLL